MKNIIFKRDKADFILGGRSIHIDLVKEQIYEAQNKSNNIFGCGLPITYDPLRIDNKFKNILDFMTVDVKTIIARLVSFTEEEIIVKPIKEEYVYILEDLKEKDYELKLRALGSKNKNDNKLRIIAFDLVRYVNYNR